MTRSATQTPTSDVRREYSARALAFPVFTIVVWVLGVVLCGGPSDPDQHFSLTQLVGAFLVFVAWSLCTFSWGRVWSLLLGVDKLGPWTMTIALGSASASLSAMVLGHLGLIGYSFFPLLFCLVLAGPLVATYLKVKKGFDVTALRIGWSGWDWLGFGVLAAVLTTWLLGASIGNGTTDPFFYHLLGPRQWVDAGRIEMTFGSPSTFHCTYWEYIIVWGISLLGGPDGKGLIEGQLFAQWLHVVFGALGCAVFIGALMRTLSLRRAWIPVAVLAGFWVPVFRDYVDLAKNDMGAASWCLAGAVILCQFPRRARDLLLAGLFLGMGAVAKIPTAVSATGFIVAWSALVLLRDRSSWLKQTFWVFLGALGPVLPIALRNWYFTGDPAFPFFDTIFHTGWLSIADTVASAGALGKTAMPREWIGNIARALKVTGPIWPIFLILPFTPAGRRQLPAACLLVGACALAVSAFAIKTFNLTFVPDGYQRWIGAGLLLVPCLAAAVLGDLIDGMLNILRGKHAAYRVIATLLPFLFAAAIAPLAWKPGMLRAILMVPMDAAIRQPTIHIGGAARAWLRLNVTRGEKIATTGEQLFYYVSNLSIISAVHYPTLEYSLDGVTDGEQAIRILREFGIKYLVDIAHWDMRFYGPFAATFVEYIEKTHPETIVYSDPQSLIIDLEQLEEASTESCVMPSGTDEDQFLRRFRFEHPSIFTYRVCNPWRFSLDDPHFRLAT